MTPAGKAIIALLGGVAVYDSLCPDGETISEGCDRLLETQPLLTELVMLSLYLHCSNRCPEQFDPIHWLFLAARWTRKRFGAH